MGDLYYILNRAKTKNKTLLECIRERNAVLHNWNGLTSLIVIKTIKKMYGFTGNIGPQTEKGYGKEGELYSRHFTKSISFWGSASQAYIPNLKSEYITEIVPLNTVLVRDNVNAIIEFLEAYVK